MVWVDGAIKFWVSIPFRAVTGFEQAGTQHWQIVSGLFQSLSGLSLGLNREEAARREREEKFQSLSGLSLGLNSVSTTEINGHVISFNPFQGCHWV